MSRYVPRHKRSPAQKRSAAAVRGSSDWALTRRVWGETTGYRWHLATLALISFAATPLALLSPVPLKIVVDSVLDDQPLPSFVDAVIPDSITDSSGGVLAIAALMLVLVTALTEAQVTGERLLQTATGEKITLRFRSRLLAHAQRLSFAFHDRRGTADSIYRIERDAPAIQYILILGILPLASSAVTLAAMIIVVFRINSQLALVALAVAPFLFASAYQYRIRMRPRYRDTKILESGALKIVQEVLTSIRVVMAFGREKAEEERFSTQSAKSMKARIQLTAFEGLYSGVVSVTTATGTAIVLVIGARSVQSGAMSLGDLLIVISYLSQLYGPLKAVSKGLASLQNHLASAERAFDLMDEVPEVREREDAIPLRRAQGAVEFRDVTFGYNPNSPVLRQVSFSAAPGSRIGIVGRTGAGKTTMVSLLTRFYDPDLGTILIDGVDIRLYRLEDLRNQFSIVLQDPVLFATSIRQNIAYARPGASEGEILQAAEAADAMTFIDRFPDGLDTVVGERGMRLSGGERQRISLARAFLRDAPILVLDEPTSSVDSVTEASIMEAMNRLMHGRTALMIAHRTGTLAGCDSLIEICDGRAELHSRHRRTADPWPTSELPEQ